MDRDTFEGISQVFRVRFMDGLLIYHIDIMADK